MVARQLKHKAGYCKISTVKISVNSLSRVDKVICAKRCSEVWIWWLRSPRRAVARLFRSGDQERRITAHFREGSSQQNSTSWARDHDDDDA